MEGGSVLDLIRLRHPKGIRDPVLLASLLKPALQAIQYLHQNDQIHRDVKASNILVAADGQVRLTDFGVSDKLKDGKKHHTLIGSPCWMAPEIFEDEEEGYDEKVDIWAFGITIIELCEGKPPYYDTTVMKAMLSIVNEEPPTLNSPQLPSSLRSMVKSCLNKDPGLRPSAEGLLSKYKSFLGKGKSPKYILQKLGPWPNHQLFKESDQSTLSSTTSQDGSSPIFQTIQGMEERPSFTNHPSKGDIHGFKSGLAEPTSLTQHESGQQTGGFQIQWDFDLSEHEEEEGSLPHFFQPERIHRKIQPEKRLDINCKTPDFHQPKKTIDMNTPFFNRVVQPPKDLAVLEEKEEEEVADQDQDQESWMETDTELEIPPF